MNYKEKEQKIYIFLARAFALTFFLGFMSTSHFAVAAASSTISNSSNTTDSAPADLPSTPIQKDPYEKFNRGVFAFNDRLDKLVLKPIATLYNKVMPRPLNQGIHNFFNNLGTLPTIANDVLQLNFYQAANDFWRFGVNSTVGVVGFFDVATRINLPYYSNDFGLTLAKWGYKNSNYLVLPFFGPSSLRDGVGIPIDYFAFSIYPYVEPTSARYELYGLGVVDRRAQLLKVESVVDEAAIDRYVFIRDAYTQRRAYQIEQNEQRGYKDQQAEMNTKDQAATVVTADTNAEFKPEAN